jgi:ribose transport system permease protein
MGWTKTEPDERVDFEVRDVRSTEEVQTQPSPIDRRSALVSSGWRSAKKVGAVNELGVLAALAALVVLVAAFHSEFVGIASISNLLQQGSFYGIIALGMVFMLSLGEVDLSVAGTFAFSAMCAALFVEHGMNAWLAAFLAVWIGVGFGAANAVMANFFRLPILIITLGTYSAYRGLVLVVNGGQSAAGGSTSSSFFSFFGGTLGGKIPASAVAFLVLTLVLSVLYRRTSFGFGVRAIGSNPTAARLSGYSIGRMRLLVAGLLGGLSGFAGVLSYAFFQSADPSVGTGFELQAIAAAVIGGTALSGGKGTVLGAFLGALLISVINGALTQFGVSINWAGVVTGVVIIGAVGLDSIVKRRQLAASTRAA